jgi:hypothetical protein
MLDSMVPYFQLRSRSLGFLLTDVLTQAAVYAEAWQEWDLRLGTGYDGCLRGGE